MCDDRAVLISIGGVTGSGAPLARRELCHSWRQRVPPAPLPSATTLPPTSSEYYQLLWLITYVDTTLKWVNEPPCVIFFYKTLSRAKSSVWIFFVKILRGLLKVAVYQTFTNHRLKYLLFIYYYREVFPLVKWKFTDSRGDRCKLYQLYYRRNGFNEV